MDFGYAESMHLLPVGLAELSIERAMATIQGQNSLPGFQSDYERANQAIAQISGPQFATPRWVNPMDIEFMGAGSFSVAMRQIDTFMTSDIAMAMQRAIGMYPRPPVQFGSRAELTHSFPEATDLFSREFIHPAGYLGRYGSSWR